VRRFARELESKLLKLDRMKHEDVVGKVIKLVKETSKIKLLSLPIPVDFGGSGYFTL